MKKKKELNSGNQEAFILRPFNQLPHAFAALITKKDKKASNFRWTGFIVCELSDWTIQQKASESIIPEIG